MLLPGTLLENIAVSRPSASDAELRAAANAAGCSDFGADLWSRDVGEQGRALSGGQRQRVALARALVRPSPVIILDEFSSALDTTTESALISALRADLDARRRTLLLITHRESTLRLVDRVVTLGLGGKVERDCSAREYARDHADALRQFEPSYG